MIFKVLGLVVEQSKAASAASAAYNRGESIPEIAQAFAKETENEIDDKIAEEVEELLEGVSTFAKQTGKICAEGIDAFNLYAPTVILNLRLLSDKLESLLPEATMRLEQIKNMAQELHDIAEDLQNRGNQ